jgi:hypothetical protein
MQQEDPEAPVPGDAPLVHSILLERAWLDDELKKRAAMIPSADDVLEPGTGSEPAGRQAREVPWRDVVDAVHERPGVRFAELAGLLPLAPARLRLAVALSIESGCVRVRRSQRPAGSEGRLAGLLSDLLLEALFSGQDVDRLKIDVLADRAGFRRAEEWLAGISEGDGATLDGIDSSDDRVTARLRHPTGRAELVLRRLGADGEPAAVSSDALFCVLLSLDSGAEARGRESRLLGELARERPTAAEMVWISSATADLRPAPPWRRPRSLPGSLEDFFASLLEARGAL